MKKSVRLLAMLLCVLSIVALLPTVAFAAEPETDAVAAASNKIANMVRSNGKVLHTYKCTVKRNGKYYMEDPLYGEYPVPVRRQWYVKKGSGKSYTKLSGATGYRYYFKATKGKNGWTYRLKVINYYNSSDYLYIQWKLKVK